MTLTTDAPQREVPPADARVTRLSPANLPRLLIPVAVGAVMWFIPAPAGVEPDAWHLLAIFVATIIAVIARPLPMGAVSMIAIALIMVTGTLTPGEALSGFSNGTIWMIVTAFMISRAVIKSGLGMRIALYFLSKIGGRTLGVAYALGVADLLIAPATPSSTARAGGIIFPITRSISSAYGSEPDTPQSSRKIGSYLTLTAYQVNCVTSAMFVTAMAANPLVVQFAADQGITITWGSWALAAIVPGLLSLALVPAVLYKIFPPEITKTPETKATAKAELAALGKPTLPEIAVTGTLVMLLFLWTVGDMVWGISATTGALIGLSVLLLVGALTWEDVKSEKGAWDTLVWFAALVMMASFLNSLGFIPWLSDQVGGMLGGLSWFWAFLALSLIYFFSHYLFASATAHVSAMYATFLAVAIVAGTPPMFAALALGFISSLWTSLTHYASGPAPVLFGAGYTTLNQWWRYGLIIGLMNLTLWMTVGGLWLRVLGHW